MHAVEAQQMRVGLDRPQVIDGNDFNVLAAALGDGAQDVAPDAPETVDGNPDGHDVLLVARPPHRREAARPA